MAKRTASPKTIRGVLWTVLSVVFFAYVVVAFFTGTGTGVNARDVFYVFMGFTTVMVLVFTAFAIDNKDHRLWTFVAATGVFWMLGDAVYRGAEIMGVVGNDRLLSPPDILYLLAYASLICAVQTFARLAGKRQKEGFDWVRFYAPGVALISFCLAGLFAYFLPNGIAVSSGVQGEFSIAAIVKYLYPALDIAILVGLLLIILTHTVPFKKSWQGLGVFGLAFFIMADVNYSLAEPAGIYSPANVVARLIIAMWILGDILILMAAVYRLTESSEGFPVSGEVTDNTLLVSD